MVASKRLIADGVCLLDLTDVSGRRLPDWEPGAHIDLSLPCGVIRQYSLCGDRWDAFRYSVAVLREPSGRASEYIHEVLQPGDHVEFGGPRNNFRLAPAAQYLFVAGGIGITPLVPMIRQAEMLNISWRLVYTGRTRNSMAFSEDLVGRFGDNAVLWESGDGPRFDFVEVVDSLPEGAKVYCCGPPSMTDSVEKACAAMPIGSFRRELFVADGGEPPVRTEPYQVELALSGKNLVLKPSESVLDAIVAAGVPLLASCRSGLCGTCETPILAGAPDHRDSILDPDERARGDVFYPCVSRSASDRLVLDI